MSIEMGPFHSATDPRFHITHYPWAASWRASCTRDGWIHPKWCLRKKWMSVIYESMWYGTLYTLTACRWPPSHLPVSLFHIFPCNQLLCFVTLFFPDTSPEASICLSAKYFCPSLPVWRECFVFKSNHVTQSHTLFPHTNIFLSSTAPNVHSFTSVVSLL